MQCVGGCARACACVRASRAALGHTCCRRLIVYGRRCEPSMSICRTRRRRALSSASISSSQPPSGPSASILIRSSSRGPSLVPLPAARSSTSTSATPLMLSGRPTCRRQSRSYLASACVCCCGGPPAPPLVCQHEGVVSVQRSARGVSIERWSSRERLYIRHAILRCLRSKAAGTRSLPFWRMRVHSTPLTDSPSSSTPPSRGWRWRGRAVAQQRARSCQAAASSP